MDTKTYTLIENYMLSCMEDSAHDKEHIYRVLYSALEIAKTETSVDYDVLICACLLHDIGRKEQYENPSLVSDPLYSLLPDGTVSDGKTDTAPSFFQEYKYKLENIYSHFYTEKGAALAKERQRAAVGFYENLFQEVSSMYDNGNDELRKCLR